MPCLIPFFNAALNAKVDVLVIGKERWFRLSDVVRILDYSDGNCISDRWSGEVRVFTAVDISGVNLGARAVRFITNDGLLAFLVSCSRPMAQLLRRWVVEEVLPSVDTVAFDMSTGQSALDKAIINELELLKKSRKDISGRQDEQINEAIQKVAEAILSWVDNAPASHVRLFQNALQEMEKIAEGG